MRRLLVPVDGSEGSIKAAQFAGNLVRDAGGEVILLYVYDVPAASTMGLTALIRSQLDDSGARVAQDSFHRAQQALGEIEPIERLVELGHPATKIVEAATKHRVTEVVMGSRGRSPVKELLLGSVSERVAHTAPCPVTIVR